MRAVRVVDEREVNAARAVEAHAPGRAAAAEHAARDVACVEGEARRPSGGGFPQCKPTDGRGGRARVARVVVKRPHHAEPIVPGPSHTIESKLVRFDVYVNPARLSGAGA